MSDVSLQAEVDWQSNYATVLREADDLEQRIDRLSGPINLDLSVDTSRLAKLDTLISDQSLDVTIDPVVESDSDLDNLLRLESESIAPKIDPTLNDAPINEVMDLDSETVSPKVDVQETDSGKSVMDRLDQIRNLGTIQLTLDLVDRMSPVVGTVLDLISTDAAALLDARTGGAIEDASGLIDDVFTTSLATSRDEAAQLLAVAQQLGVPFHELEAAVSGAFDTAIVQGEDVNEVLSAADLIIKSGMATNFTDAYDIITAGFQSGANQGGEFLSVLREYGTTFDEMGFSANEMLSALDSGLGAGIDNADRIADLIRETRIKAMEVDNTAVNDAYAALGLTDDVAAFRAGELTGAQLWEGLTTALKDKSTGDQSFLLAQVSGTQSEDFGAESVLSITTQNEAFDNLEGRMEQASETFQDTLGQTLTTFWETVQVEAGEFLSSDQLGLADKVNAIKDGLSDALDVLQEGGTLGEALEVGLEIKGVDEFIHQFQSAMGNFVIAILQVVATLQELIPGGSAGTETRAQIADLATAQLAFDLEGATADDVSRILTTAVQRGVDEAAVGQALTDQINTMVQSGDIGGARELLAQFGEGNAANVDASALSAQVDGLAQQVLGQFHTALATGDVDLATALAQGLGSTETLNQAFDAAFAAGRLDLAGPLAEQLTDPTAVAMVQNAFQTLRDDALSAIESGDTQSFLDTAALAPDDATIQQIAEDNAAALTAAFDTAIANQDTDTAQAIADLLDDSALQTRVDDLKASIQTAAADVGAGAESMAAAVEDADGRIGTATTGNTITTNLEAVGTAGTAMGVAMSEGAAVAADAIALLDQSLTGTVTSILTKIATLQTAMSNAQNLGSGMSGGGPTIEQNYAGGVADGWSWVGERGPELMHFDQSAAILNNQSSMRMMDLLGGGMGGGVSVYNTWNINSGAQADAAVTRMLNGLRGYA